MDLQLPIMRGYESREAMRKLGKTYKNIPIIALSADAMTGIIERVKEAGMNDFVSKPIIIKELFDALNKWIKPDSSRKVNTIDVEEEANEVNFTVLHRIDYNDGLNRVANNQKVYIDILRKYQKNYTDFISRLRDDVKNEKDDVARTLHTLKGVAGNIGATQSQAITKKLETAYKAEKDILKMDEIKQLKESLDLDLLDIKQFLDTIVESTKQGDILSDQDLLEALNKLLSKLEDYDTECEEIFDSISSTLNSKNIKYDAIQEDIASYEFENAVEKVQQIIKEVQGG
jgi:CheY-like chemotaxis protein